jgi:hypothetical protein
MKSKNFLTALALILALAMAAPSFGYVSPTGNRIDIPALDDHPWGGEFASNISDVNRPSGTELFIGSPFSFLSFFQIIGYSNIRTNISIIRGEVIYRRQSTISNSSTSTDNQGIISRGN